MEKVSFALFHVESYGVPMHINQLKYVVAVAESGTFTDAARNLFISQPSLTASVKALEKEMGISIFSRTNKGADLTAEGEEFLGYARQLIEQASLIEERYKGPSGVKHRFCVSTQHYSFAVDAFVDLIRGYEGDEYDFRIRETQTYEIIEDVARLKSEVGVLYLNDFNEPVIRKALRENHLEFHHLFTASPHVFVSSGHPLADRKSIGIDELEPYPRLSYEQGEHNAFYYAEEMQSTRTSKKDILVRDRATLFNLVIGLNGYTVCSGIINRKLNGEGIISVPLEVDDRMEIGYISHARVKLGYFGQRYVEALRMKSVAGV